MTTAIPAVGDTSPSPIPMNSLGVDPLAATLFTYAVRAPTKPELMAEQHQPVVHTERSAGTAAEPRVAVLSMAHCTALHSVQAASIYQHCDEERQEEVAAGLDGTVRKARIAAGWRRTEWRAGDENRTRALSLGSYGARVAAVALTCTEVFPLGGRAGRIAPGVADGPSEVSASMRFSPARDA
ncbi:hypothetical protein ABT063_31530 [Streptomyces sp. NPDC002838]|uniref:hypothetical protein n=1 Tax=Streptomyces sp. NPDC002838 TaxID=3154436 RepID=UPI00332B0B8C